MKNGIIINEADNVGIGFEEAGTGSDINQAFIIG